MVSETSPNGNATIYGFNPASELVTAADPLGKVTTTVRDMAGRPVRAVDRLGRVTDSVFDLAGRNTQTQDKGLGGTQTPLVSSVTYDKAANVVTSTTPRGTVGGSTYRTGYGYDGLGRRTAITEPTDGTVGGEINTYVGYDANGNQTSTRNGRSASVTDNAYQTTSTYNPWHQLRRWRSRRARGVAEHHRDPVGDVERV